MLRRDSTKKVAWPDHFFSGEVFLVHMACDNKREEAVAWMALEFEE